MRHGTLALIAATCFAILPGGEANAQGRGPSALELQAKVPRVEDTPEARAAKLAELDAWLRRLVGRYRVTGTVNNTYPRDCIQPNDTNRVGTCYSLAPPDPLPIEGMADCAGIGHGPGVHCVIRADWEVPRYPVAPIIWHPWLNPGMILLGIDPDERAIRYLQVTDRSIAEQSGPGTLERDIATFRFSDFPFLPHEPGRGPSPHCQHCRTVRIRAEPEGGVVVMSTTLELGELAVWYEFKLERLPNGQTSEHDAEASAVR